MLLKFSIDPVCKTLPNFMMIGAAKSGTSSLYYYLGQHPEIYTSPIKGPCFFAFEEGQSVKVNGPGDQEMFDRFVVTDFDAYRALFSGVKDEAAIGEASVLYLYSPAAPARIKHYIPEIRLIVCLRNPIDRAFSSFLHLRREGREPLTDFKDALAAEEVRITGNWQHLWHYTQLGFYHAQLKRYYDLFDPGQIAVYTHEEFKASPLKVLQDICQFLNVDKTFVPDMSVRRNVSGTPRSRSINNFLFRPNRLKAFVKLFLSDSMRRRWLVTAAQWNQIDDKPLLTQDIRRQLRDLYKEDILKLESLIQRDLSAWLEVESQ